MTKQELEQLINDSIVSNDCGRITADILREILLALNANTGGGGGGSVTIEQNVGSSTTSVMSQKAVTDEVERLDGRIDDVPSLPALSKVATSGDYNDLKNTPSEVTESTVSGWGFTKNQGTYIKPAAGIPKSDLASSVQTSLGKADTALQEHQDISGKQDKVVIMTSTAGGMQPDRRYRVMLSSDIDITLIAPSDVYAHSYEIDMEVTEAHSVSFPSYVEWVKDLTIEAGKRYLIAIDYNGSDYIAMYTTTEIGG